MPPQIFRPLLIGVLALCGYLAFRVVFAPASFGEFGHYRGAALGEVAAKPPSYAGNESCESCHEEILAEHKASKHKSQSCEACHGPMAKHGDDPDIRSEEKPAKREHCGLCHSPNPARPKKFPQVDFSKHGKGGDCLECHLTHRPETTRKKP